MPFVIHQGRPILFVHVPKTGGTSVEAWLETLGPLHLRSTGQPPAMRCTPQHLRLQDIRLLFGDAFFAHAFMMVRDPFARVASEYRMRAAMGGPVFKRRQSFSLWLENVLRRAADDPFALDHHLRPQWEFGGTGVEVLRFEDGVDRAIGRIADRLGVPPPEVTPHEARPPGAPADIEWDEADVIRVRDAYARDFETFGYDPEGPPRRRPGGGVRIG